MKQYLREWRKRNPDKQRSYDRARDPVRVRARQAVAVALRQGKIVRPEKCSNCQVTAFVEAHHADYTQPLLITWLCEPCHDAVGISE
jgi:hypothetical protein